MNLKNRRILITAGPTWVPIDNVRVISNIASGETGILLAKKFAELEAKVTLLLGPVSSLPGDGCASLIGGCSQTKSLDLRSGFRPEWNRRTKQSHLRLLRFTFFDELKAAIFRELKTKKYDIVIHSAAVSDYRPEKICNQKIPSGIKRLKFELVPTVKIINLIKKFAPGVFLVGFKFAPGLAREKLFREAKKLISEANLDLAVANSIDAKRYSAYILRNSLVLGPLHSKKNLVEKLGTFLNSNINCPQSGDTL